MYVKVRLFAVLRQQVGHSVVLLDLPERSTVADLKNALATAYPALGPLLPNIMIALNSEYASDETPVPENGDIAAIPPVSGGSQRCEPHHG